MGTRVRFARWFKIGRIWYVQPPDWPKDCELSFTEQSAMQKWAENNRYMLRDGNGHVVRRKEVRNGKFV